jgi:hypothetical protein
VYEFKCGKANMGCIDDDTFLFFYIIYGAAGRSFEKATGFFQYNK